MDHNPQAAQMADESMVRNLAAQAEAIWPQERPLLARYGLGDAPRVLDLACGTGEASARLLALFPGATLEGIDLDEAHLVRARARCAEFGDRARFRVGDAFATGLPDGAVDLAVCRHLLQAVPAPERVLAELARVTRPGGRVHVLAEDYGMMHFHPTTRDMDRFWREGPVAFGAATGTDLRIGRKAFTILKRLGLRDVRVDYVVVDPVRVDRAVFSRIWTAWRDGYTDVLAERTGIPRDEVLACWDEMIACIERDDGYAVWQVPVVSGSPIGVGG